MVRSGGTRLTAHMLGVTLLATSTSLDLKLLNFLKQFRIVRSLAGLSGDVGLLSSVRPNAPLTAWPMNVG